MEIWVDIRGFEGIYQVSSLGNIKSFKKVNGGKILSNKNSKGGYLSIILCKGDKRRCTRVHRLVAESFIPNPYKKPQINHIDGNKQNNNVNNLEWATRRENMAHAMTIKPELTRGINRYNKFIRPKPVQQFSLNGGIISEFPNAKEAAKATGVCARNILQVANHTEHRPGKTRSQAGGFVWRFKANRGSKNEH